MGYRSCTIFLRSQLKVISRQRMGEPKTHLLMNLGLFSAGLAVFRRTRSSSFSHSSLIVSATATSLAVMIFRLEWS